MALHNQGMAFKITVIVLLLICTMLVSQDAISRLAPLLSAILCPCAGLE